MRKLLAFIFIVALACSGPNKTDKPTIAVTILPQKYFVEKIAGDLVQVNVLVPPGASPELYSLMPSQMTGLSTTLAWLGIGQVGFEQGWVDKIRTSNPKLAYFDTSEQADWIAGEEEIHGDHVHLHGIDPHIWSSPEEVKKIATETYKALAQVLPEHKETFEANLAKFQAEIDSLDEELKQTFEQLPSKKFLIFHPALTYLARQYGLEQVAMEVDGKEPSPKHLKELAEMAKNENIKAIFVQKEFNMDNARQMAKEIGGEVIQVDPLSENWADELRTIAKKIAQAEEIQ
ncbi:metal ABC transporter solute-binding protein, Zn/Mn family [Mangrovibacterium diazotrophicum]|uniref:Zinc transport system substrate-binding protein n=1 Tax=Mangrovibacterium diazotrophicum TaxID=1261403 RepID=A0A419W906_9BACT|nr:zinc ABC transporter substrate-binding protein [Mangrovibacterium diazotrophicum]RKD91929.1 zinc transport system substrate-binding protein [Mangrovibacterium diazotrophicum]